MKRAEGWMRNAEAIVIGAAVVIAAIAYAVSLFFG
jgi:hypothetical protein